MGVGNWGVEDGPFLFRFFFQTHLPIKKKKKKKGVAAAIDILCSRNHLDIVRISDFKH